MNNSNEIIERVITLDDYQPHPRNYNKHPNAQIERLVHSLDKFGQVRNIVVWRQWFIAGHGVAQAAVESGRTTLRANVIPDDWPEERVLAYLAADNELGKLSQPDDAQLLAILDEVKQYDHELLLASGFDQERFDDLIRSVEAGLEPPKAGDESAGEVSKADELQQKWLVQEGQIWKLGDHLIACGDSTDNVLVDRLMAGQKAQMVVTDPPYGVNYTGKTEDELPVHNDDAEGLPELLDGALGNALRVCEPGAVWYVAAPAGRQFHVFASWLLEKDIWRQTITWVKDSMVMGHSDYHYQHEAIFYGWAPGAAHLAPPDRTQTTVWEIARPKASELHPTMKPVELFTRAIQNSSRQGWIVYEPFSGSGTTILACEQLGRQCRAIEKGPEYVSVALERWHQLTGEMPTLVDG